MTLEEKYKSVYKFQGRSAADEELAVAELAKQMRSAIAAGKGTIAQVAAGLPQVGIRLAAVVDNIEFLRGMRRYLAAKQVIAEQGEKE